MSKKPPSIPEIRRAMYNEYSSDPIVVARAQKFLVNSFKRSIKNLEAYRKKEAAARAKAEANEANIVAMLSTRLPPARAPTRAEITNLVGGANALLKVAGKNNGSYYKNGRRHFPG